MPEDPTPTPAATEADDDLRRQLNEEVMQLAGMYANKDGDEAWQQELKTQQARQLEKDKAAMQASKSTASSGTSELFADILGGALAHLTWIIGGAVVLAAVGGGAWLWTGTHAVDELQEPLTHNVPRDGERSERPAPARPGGLPRVPASAQQPQKITPAQMAAAKAALATAAKNAQKAGDKSGLPGVPPGGAKGPGAGGEAGSPQAGGAAKPGAPGGTDGTPKVGTADAAKYAEAAKEAGAGKGAAEKAAPQSEEAQLKGAAQKSGGEKDAKKPAANAPDPGGPKPAGQPQKNSAQKPPAAPRMAALTKEAKPGVKKPSVVELPKPLAQPSKPKAAKATHRVNHSPALITKLQALWKQGKAAKHSGDIATARKDWEQALRLCPGHPGFGESLAKLPHGK